MNFRIEQLNFLYLYKYCQENHLNVDIYDTTDIEDICKDDVYTILKYIFFKENIINSYDEIIFDSKIEKYINRPDTINLAEVGTVLNKKIQYVAKLKDDLNILINRVSDKEFIYYFEAIMSNKRDIKDTLKVLLNIKNSNTKNNAKNSNKSRATSFLLS